MRRVTVVALLGALLVGLLATATAAQDTAREPIVGSWQLAAKQSGGDVSISLGTFFADGNYVGSDPVSQPGQNGLLYSSAAHGSWAPAGAGVDVTFWQLISDSKGAVAAAVLIDATLTIDSTGNGLSGPFYVQLEDPTGKVLQTATGTVTGSRIVVQPMPSPAASPSAS